MTIEDAIRLTATAHKGQVDKAGKPYIYHLMRVCNYAPEEFRIAAILHDILEDTDFTVVNLRAWGVEDDDIEIVELVSHVNGESYEDFISRIIYSGNLGALYVKLADIKDHLNNPNPLPITPPKYLIAFDRLNKALHGKRFS